MVGVTKIQRGNMQYWLNAVAEGGDDYYTRPGEAPGEWVGSLAEEFGLQGQIDAAAYTAILEGCDPRNGAQLLTRPATRFRLRPDGSEQRIEPVLGFDVRFSAPKSVSLLYALGDERTQARVVSIMDRAVRAGIAHLESRACLVQRGKGGKVIERGEGFFGMAFRHRMSRAGDPALHVHVLVSNLTRALSDGRWLSLASPRGRSALWLDGKSAGVVFQAALRAEFLREFGFEFGEIRNGYADLLGFSREAIEALSTRSREIATWMEQHGVFSVDAAQTAAYRTRDGKDYGVDVDRRVVEWIEQLAPFDLTPERILEMARQASPREPRTIEAADIDAALSQLERTVSHFDDRALLWAIADQLPEGADLNSLHSALERAIAGERVICIHQAAGPLERSHYTTPYIAALERSFIDGALAGQGAGVGVVEADFVYGVLDRHPYLGADQRAMILRLTTGGERVVPVDAWPGTGKTTALSVAREAWEAAGFRVIGVAAARSASGELADAGVPSTSIAALLNRAERWRVEGHCLPRGTVILVDEASAVATTDLEDLRVLAVECDGKLAAIGDTRQIGAVGPGGAYAHLTRVVEPSTLDVIRRQASAEDRELVALVHEGRGSEALDLLRTRGRVIVGDDLPATLGGVLADWHRDFATGADVAMIARRNRDVEFLNDRARELRAAEGRLGEAEIWVGERAFAVGDRVQTRINSHHAHNRERWDVVGLDGAARTVDLRRVGGDERVVRLSPRYLDRRTDDGAPALQHAYALTKFGAQGKTFDRVYPLLDAGSSLEDQLVAISRGREVANVYIVAASELVDPELGPGRREVADALHDVRIAIEREGSDFLAAEVTLRKQIGAMAPSDLARRRAELIAAGRADHPELGPRDRLDAAIARREQWVFRLRRELGWAQEGGPTAPEGEWLARTLDRETRALGRDREQREALGEPQVLAAAPKPADAAQRLEASLVEQRIETLARREVAAARLDSSQPIYKALGPYPSDPEHAAAWGNAAHAISTYRFRHGVHDSERPLGGTPKCAEARAERERAQRRIEVVQRRVDRDLDRGIEQAVEHSLTLDL